MIRGRANKRKEIHNLLQDQIPLDLLSEIPQRWWYIGDVLIVSIPKNLQPFRHIIGEVFLEVEHPKARAVLGKVGPTKEIIRTPEIVHLAGDDNSETVHRELRCKFKIDAGKITFSPGNHGERKRLVELVKQNEFIIDMFSCVGNLSLPLGVNNNPMKIIAAEINPLAYNYLVENIKLNKIDNCMEAIFGDNRVVLSSFENQADRVLSGYFDSDDQQKRLAFRLCKCSGMIHFHETIKTSNDEMNKIIKKLKELCEQENKTIEDISYKRVKKYSPNIDHLVFDVKLA